MLVQTTDHANTVLNRLRQHEGKLVLDVETSGLNPRKNHVVAYVLTFGPAPEDTYYIPLRHARGGNLDGAPGIETAEGWDKEPHWFEVEMRDITRVKQWEVIGHNLVFDLLFAARAGIFFPNCKLSCTQVTMAVVNELCPSFSLDASAKYMEVTAKKGDELYAYIASLNEGLKPERKAMSHYWTTPGNNELVVDYAMGDGVTTWELYHAQMEEVNRQELNRVWELEQRVLRVLFTLQHRGIRMNNDSLLLAKSDLENKISAMQRQFSVVNKDTGEPENFNERSKSHLLQLFYGLGYTDDQFKRTEKGNISFTEDWLENDEIGRKIIELRQSSNMINSFVGPMLETHLFEGRVFPGYNQLKTDDFGTVTGRLSSNNPNIQQVPKHNEVMSRIFRLAFEPDDGMLWSSNDYSQCLAGDTKVLVPGGEIEIKDIKVGDYVYSYTDDKQPILRKVTWWGQTGIQKLHRLRWLDSSGKRGYLDATSNHPIRTHDGSYKTVGELISVNTVIPVWGLINVACFNDVIHNYTIIDIEELPGEHPVYDITVEDTHNFIANEICVHNCEPRLFAQYSESPYLIDGYLQVPPVDLYTALGKVTGIESRQTCKRLALALFYGAGNAKAAEMIGCSVTQAKVYRSDIYRQIPQIKNFIDNASRAAERRYATTGVAYVKSGGGRKLRFGDLNFLYKASNRVVQATNADLIKFGICEVQEYLESTGKGNVLLTCHDSIDWQFEEGADDVNAECIKLMENCAQYVGANAVPQKVDNGIGRNWAEATFGAAV